MGEYRWIANIKYNESRFKVLSDNHLQKFYLKILDDNSLMYPTLEEFKELNGIFNQDINMNSKSENENISSNKSKNKYSFIAKVINKGALISLASALVLIGSANEINSHYESEKLKEMTDIQILKEYNYEVEEITEDILITKIEPNYKGKKLVFCKTAEEFKRYLDVKDPTFRDLKEAVQENENIGDRYKEWLYTGIENLETSNINMDLSTLYYNLKRMKVIEASKEEIYENTNNTGIAYFSSDTSSVVINPTTVTDYIFYHEALGHAMTECIIDKNNERIYKSFNLRIFNSLDKEDYKNMIAHINSVGNGGKEGIADIIASIASNKSVREGHYDIESAQLLIFKDALGIDYKDLIDNGVYGIFNNMLDIGMNSSSLEYIDNMDALNSAHKQRNIEIDDSITLQGNVKEFFFYLAKAKIDKGESKDDVINDICSVLDNSELKMIPKGAFIPYDGYMSQVDFTSMTLIRDEIIDNIKDYEKDKDTISEEEIIE